MPFYVFLDVLDFASFVLNSLFLCPESCKYITCSDMPDYALKCHFDVCPVNLVGEVLKMAFLGFL